MSKMHPEKDQITKSDDASEDEQIATSTEGSYLLILQINSSTATF